MDDDELVAAIRRGDERAFTTLVARYHDTLVRVARYYVGSAASAEDVAQDTWVAVVRGLDRFEGRSSVKTWLLRILANRARTTGVREHRTIPVDPTGSVAADRFDAGGGWRTPPVAFETAVDDRIAGERLVGLARDAIARLPEVQQAVVTLRDVEGLSTAEVAELLDLTPANVRVILHRGRAKVRSDCESALRGGAS